MDMSGEKTAVPDGGASIRLRYSTQLQSGGRTHMIDAESTIPLGASQELREQIIRETELGVEQLARRITQHNTQPPTQYSGRTSQGAVGGSLTVPMTASPGAPAPSPSRSEMETDGRRQSSGGSSIPPTRAVPVGESMPSTPAAGREKSIRLADFMQAIKDHLHLSPKDAMDLLNVKTLDGLNYREVYRQLQEILRQRRGGAPAQPTQTSAVLGTQRTVDRRIVPPTTSRSTGERELEPPLGSTQNRSTAPVAPRPAPPVTPVPTQERPAMVTSGNTGAEKRVLPPAIPGVEFAGSAKSPLPIRLGNVRDVEPPPYKFEEEEEEDVEGIEDEDEEKEEEEEEEEFVLPGNNEDQLRASALAKLEKLQGERGTTVTSVERLTVLNNVISGQISEPQLQQLILAVWGLNTKKKLKAPQVEALISWAKEDFFADEVETMLALIEEGEI